MYEAEDDIYCYPGTTVLKNRAGLRLQVELEKFEITNFQLCASQPIPFSKLDDRFYRRLHRHLFGKTYSWAGRYRTIRISKDDSPFCYPEYIAGYMHRLFENLAGMNYLCDLEAVDFAHEATHFLTELNAIHPFREGNGRTQNIYLGLLADLAGHPINNDKLDSNELLEAMILSFKGDEQLLAEVILRSLRG